VAQGESTKISMTDIRGELLLEGLRGGWPSKEKKQKENEQFSIPVQSAGAKTLQPTFPWDREGGYQEKERKDSGRPNPKRSPEVVESARGNSWQRLLREARTILGAQGEGNTCSGKETEKELTSERKSNSS